MSRRIDWTKVQMPDTYIIIFFVVLLAALATWIIPVGKFQMEKKTYIDAHGKEKSKTVPIAESFAYELNEEGQPVKKGVRFFEPYGGVGVSNYAFEGLCSGSKWGSAVGVVTFILLIGGAFGIVLKTGAVDAGILKLISFTKGTEIAIIPIMFLLFSLGGAVFGMGEEAIAFAMILVPVTISLGYDAITGIMITYVATQIGFATSPMNPFSTVIAQGVAGVPIMSGQGFRWIMWAIFTLVGIIFTLHYAIKVKKDPTSSISYESDGVFRNEVNHAKDVKLQFTIGHGVVLSIILATIVWVVWGVTQHAYYIPEIATQFFVMGIAAGIAGVIFKLNNMTLNDIASSFRNGAKDLLGAALVVGMAKGIVLVLGGDGAENATVLNTFLHHAGSMLGGLPTAISAWFMYVFQSIFNFFVVSGSGQAALTMPLMAPLAEIAGVTRQVAVLAFQLGDGLTNIIVPTSGSLIGTLAVAKLPWSKWFKFCFKFQILIFIMASVFMLIAVMIGFK